MNKHQADARKTSDLTGMLFPPRRHGGWVSPLALTARPKVVRRARHFMVVAALALVGVAARGQIYVGGYYGGGVGEYSLSGATINSSFVSFSGPTAVAYSGGKLFVAGFAPNSGSSSGVVGVYDASSGAAINSTLITGLNQPTNIAVSGSNLYASPDGKTVGLYNAGTGAAINSSLFTVSGSVRGLVVFGSNIFALDYDNGTVGVYDALSGAPVNASFITGLNHPHGIAIANGDLFVTNFGGGSIGEYDATTGATINSAFIGGLNGPAGIAVLGNNLYVANTLSGSVGQYNATTGAMINASLIVGLGDTYGISAIPEPSTYGVIAGVFTLGLAINRRRGLVRCGTVASRCHEVRG